MLPRPHHLPAEDAPRHPPAESACGSPATECPRRADCSTGWPRPHLSAVSTRERLSATSSEERAVERLDQRISPLLAFSSGSTGASIVRASGRRHCCHGDVIERLTLYVEDIA